MKWTQARIFSALIFLVGGQSALAAEKIHHFAVNRLMQISYGSPDWNLDSTKVDSAYLVLRDRNTGKLVQIQLEETEPDSSQFTGFFSVNVGDKTISPEIYIPPKDLRGTDSDNRKLYQMIQTGKLARKPVIWKPSATGQAVLEVYDTREQAEAGLKAFREQERLAYELKHKTPLKPMSKQAAQQAAEAAERKAELNQLAMKAAEREAERVRLEQIERQKTLDKEQEQRRLSEQQKADRQRQALDLEREASDLYAKADFIGAEEKFKKASELDPGNKDYYFKYGVSLYRNQKYNEALVTLKLAKVSADKVSERSYYMGLIHYRLAELDASLKAFDEVSQSKDPALAPSATFYRGVILFAKEDYDHSKSAFENVIDTSNDPRLDDQADSYLDRIATAMAWQKLREKKFTLIGVVGAMYDSNVVLNPSNNSGTGNPTNSPDFRLITIMDLQYRPIFTDHQQWMPHATINLTNSAKTTSAKADPFVYDVAAPYSYRQNTYQLTLTPGYEWLFMDPNDTGTKNREMESYFLTVDNTFVMSPKWVSTYTVEYRKDKSFDPSLNGPSDLTADKFTARTTQTFYLDKSRKSALMPMLSYIRNPAKGSEKTYNRYDVGLTYLRPVGKDMSWTAGLAYYQMVYPGTDPKRTDNDFTFTTGVSKPIRDWVTWGLNGTYIKNGSSDVNSAYDKYMILTTATFNTNF